MNNNSAERKVRRILSRNGATLHKSRTQHINLDDFGGYRITDDRNNAIIAGDRFDLSLDDAFEIAESMK